MNSAAFHKRVRSKFSGAAETYAALCGVQADVARELADRLPLQAGLRVLDVGAGTGMLAEEIYRRCAWADVVGLDLADRMVEVGRKSCRKVRWLQADAAALPFGAESFGLVVSSSSYQWVADLALAFSEAGRVLVPGGRFYAAMFGRETLSELFESLQAAGLARGREDVFALRRMPSEEAVRAALRQADFRHRGMAAEKREAWFRDIWSLLKWLQGTGSNGLSGKFFLGREFLAETEEHCRTRFGTPEGIRVTFEVLWIDAVR
ncbi:MAG: methyltransferase domain-containing protein [Candidatus Omnitrophica bacterium]|nr:methyltransferase domain-containing protein [Candidatus Omnitrophota bacterium]